MSDTERSTLALEIVSQALASYSGSRYYINTKDVGVSNRKTSMTTRMTWALGREPNGENPTNIVRNMMFGNRFMGHFDDDANNLANNSHPAASQRSSVGLSCKYTFVASSCSMDKNPHSLAKYRLPSGILTQICQASFFAYSLGDDGDSMISLDVPVRFCLYHAHNSILYISFCQVKFLYRTLFIMWLNRNMPNLFLSKSTLYYANTMHSYTK